MMVAPMMGMMMMSSMYRSPYGYGSPFGGYGGYGMPYGGYGMPYGGYGMGMPGYALGGYGGLGSMLRYF
jgi:hypothetical protein